MAAKRMTIMGTRHVVSAGHYLAAHAGFQVLEAGGNAIDAGVAAGIAIDVLQTDKVSFGGVAPQIIYTAKNRKVHCIDGLGTWPKAITSDYFMKRHGGKIPPSRPRHRHRISDSGNASTMHPPTADQLWQQIVWLFVLAIPVACVAWTVTRVPTRDATRCWRSARVPTEVSPSPRTGAAT